LVDLTTLFAGFGHTMSTATPVEKIRAAIAAQLSSFGAPTVESLHETILIRNGLFCGRKFQCEGHEVVWFIEEDEIKFFSPCGDLLKSATAIACVGEYELKCRESEQSERRAA
jgi:hypothetical protein